MRELKQVIKSENLIAAGAGVGAFAGSIMGIEKLGFMNDKPALKKIIIPALLIILAFKFVKKPQMRIAIFAGAGIVMAKAIFDYYNIDAGKYIPINTPTGSNPQIEYQNQSMLTDPYPVQGDDDLSDNDVDEILSGYAEDDDSVSSLLQTA